MIQTADRTWNEKTQRYEARKRVPDIALVPDIVSDKSLDVPDITGDEPLCSRCRAILAAKKRRLRRQTKR